MSGAVVPGFDGVSARGRKGVMCCFNPPVIDTMFALKFDGNPAL